MDFMFLGSPDGSIDHNLHITEGSCSLVLEICKKIRPPSYFSTSKTLALLLLFLYETRDRTMMDPAVWYRIGRSTTLWTTQLHIQATKGTSVILATLMLHWKTRNAQSVQRSTVVFYVKHYYAYIYYSLLLLFIYLIIIVHLLSATVTISEEVARTKTLCVTRPVL